MAQRHFAFEFDSGALDPMLLVSPGQFQEEPGGPNVVNGEEYPPDPVEVAPFHKEDFPGNNGSALWPQM